MSLEVVTDEKPGSMRVGDPLVDVTLRKTVREATVARLLALALIVAVS